jgi:uncharacterized protein (DUF983 family)
VSHLSRAEFREAIRRGWSKRCPHCGNGALFIGWNKPHRCCPVCGYLYERDYGDVWWVWIVTDRIPIGIGIVLLYFALLRVSLAAAAAHDSATLRPGNRHHLPHSEAMAGSKG